MSRRAAFRLLLLGLLLCWCGVFLRSENTERSMVRALALEHTAGKWNVALLYQFPEAAADSSEATAAVRLCTGAGQTLEQALFAAEAELPQRPGYRLCDYLLLHTEDLPGELSACESLLCQRTELRQSARVLAFTPDWETLQLRSEEDAVFPEQLLQRIKESAAVAPRLYEGPDWLLFPVLQTEEGSVDIQEEGLLLTGTKALFLPTEQTEMARVLLELGQEHTFWQGTQPICIRRSILGVQAEGETFRVQLTFQQKAGAPEPTEAQRQALEALCIETIQVCWDAGADLLSLGSIRALRDGPGAFFRATKSACPTLQADVQFLG